MGSLSEKQKSLIEGCLLGDGYMRCKTNAHLQITHSIKQKDYVDWKYENLSEFILTPPKSYKGKEQELATASLPEVCLFLQITFVAFIKGKRLFQKI